MNIHHLELFYYVAKHGGITEAVRNIPYGIQQPAVSSQVAQIEEYLGVALFHRRPFALTAAGQKLYDFVHPFFSNIDSIAVELQGGTERQIRIGASNIVLRDHLPALFLNVQKRFPGARITLREGFASELENLIQSGELDIAVTLLEKKSYPGINSRVLLELPLVLLASSNAQIKDAGELWKADRIEHPLVCLPPGEAVSKNFQRGLSKLEVDWFTSIEVSSLNLIEAYVANGFGIGVSVRGAKTEFPAKVRVIPLPDFPPVVFGVLWKGKASKVVQALLDDFRAEAKLFEELPH